MFLHIKSFTTHMAADVKFTTPPGGAKGQGTMTSKTIFSCHQVPTW